jgi:hypothetical protein
MSRSRRTSWKVAEPPTPNDRGGFPAQLLRGLFLSLHPSWGLRPDMADRTLMASPGAKWLLYIVRYLASLVTLSGTWPCCGFRPDVPDALARW